MLESPRHDGCVKPKRASRKSVEEPLGKRGKKRQVPEESDKVGKKRRGPSVSKPAQEDQPQSGKKTAGRSRGLQHEGCRAAKARRKPVASMKNHTEPTATKPLLFIGLDVHKESIAVAIAEEGRAGEMRSHGSISGDLHALEKVQTRPPSLTSHRPPRLAGRIAHAPSRPDPAPKPAKRALIGLVERFGNCQGFRCSSVPSVSSGNATFESESRSLTGPQGPPA